MDSHLSRVGWVLTAIFALMLVAPAGVWPQQHQDGARPSLTGSGSQGQTSQPSQPAPSLRNPQGSQPAPSSAPPAVSPAETQAYNALAQELDPDKQLQLALDFIKKYPQSTLLSDVYFMAGGAAERKNDVPDALKYGEASLKLAPNNLRSLILVAGLLPLPQALPAADPQKEQQLTDAETDASRALQMLPNVTRQNDVAPDQFKRGMEAIESQLHSALGMAHLEKAVLAPGGTSAPELSLAEQEYKAAVATPQPIAQDYYRLGEVCTRESKWDDAVSAFTQAAQLGQGTMIAKYANDMIAKVKAQQAQSPPSAPANGAGASATPAPPAAAPAKKP